MRTLRDALGGAALEFALILPLLIFIVAGIIEFGLALYDKAVITNASREGARTGIVFRMDPSTGERNPLTVDEIEERVNGYLGGNPLISPGGVSPAIEVPEICVESGDEISVKVSYMYQFILVPDFGKVFGKIIPGAVPITAETVMRCE